MATLGSIRRLTLASQELVPENAGAAAQSGYKFLVALHGSEYTYIAPADGSAFISNAVSSIQALAGDWSSARIELERGERH